jgi:3-hydroxybutyryl-CoA dehydrogenase
MSRELSKDGVPITNERLPGGFHRVAVVGAGLLGRRIAGVYARGGYEVVVTDTNAKALQVALPEAREVAGANGAVSAVSDLETAVGGADLVVEAIVEDLPTKQQLFARIAEIAPAAVLASNTSVLSITAIGARVKDSARLVGTHWWNPPDLIPIVEVIRGERTDTAVMDRLVDNLTHLGKLPVRVEKDVPGGIGNRLQHAMWREAISMVADGVCDARAVDQVIRNTLGLRLGAMGPMENADYVGLDLTLSIHEAVLPSLNRDPHPHPMLREFVERNHLGAKTGQGFLAWRQGDREESAARLSEHIAGSLRLPTVENRTSRESNDRSQT